MTTTAALPVCPVCSGPVWDQKTGKYPWKPGTPIFKCRDKACAQQGGVIWEPKGNGKPVEQSHIGVQALSTPPMQMTTNPAPSFTPKPALPELFDLYDRCFAKALEKAIVAEQAGIGSDLTGVSAVAATLFIQARK